MNPLDKKGLTEEEVAERRRVALVPSVDNEPGGRRRRSKYLGVLGAIIDWAEKMRSETMEDLIGKRVIVSIGRSAKHGYISEHTVIEVSPSREYVKARNALTSVAYWHRKSEFHVLETLS